MRYTDHIAKSQTDTEYAGGEVFKQLVEEGTIVPFNDDIYSTGLIVFTLDRFCYTGKVTKATDTRAYILIDTPFPMQRSVIRLILCDGADRKAGKMKLLEVLPAPDPEFPIFGNDWMHKLSWFLKAEAFGINLYEYVISRCLDKKYLTGGFNLRNQPIETAKDRITFLEEFWDLVNYVNEQTHRGSSRYGCQQRSRKYAEQLKKLIPRVKCDTSPRPAMWGFVNSDGYFDKADNYVTMVMNYAHDIIKSNNMDDLEFIKTHFEYIVRASKLEIDLPSEVIDCSTLETYRQTLMDLAVKQNLIYDSFNLDF